MNGRYFVDTDIFLYAHDNSSQKKQIIARELIYQVYSTGSAVISTQVMAEFFQNFAVKFKRPYSDVIKEMHYMSRCKVIEQTMSLLLEGARLFNRYSVSLWDALIIAAAAEAGAETLYSEDLQYDQVISGVKIVNPFLG